MNVMNEDTIKLLLKEEYAIIPRVFEKSAWGYNTVAYYVQHSSDTYVVKVTPTSKEKLVGCQKDVLISTLLSPALPTPRYLKNRHGEYMTNASDLIIRVAHYIEGTSPFKMNIPVYKQIIQLLAVLHTTPVDSVLKALLGQNLNVLDGGSVFLHGDLTPSNVIVADDKVVGLMDFEDSLIGPVEYDLARSAVFSWFRMDSMPFKDLVDLTMEEYKGSADRLKMLNYCVRHARNHLKQVVEHKGSYKDEVFWNDDYNFSSKALKEIESLIIAP